MDIDIYSPCKEGYEIKHSFDGWMVAYLCYAEKYDTITYIERHLETDEIFVLLKGSATLLIGEDLKHTEMEINKIYNVQKGVWHNIKVSRDALVLIVENKNTCVDNSEYMPIDKVNSTT